MSELFYQIYFNPVALVIAGLLFLMILLAPTEVAYTRRHNNRLAIMVLNIALGLTGIGWGVALVWACTNDVQKD